MQVATGGITIRDYSDMDGGGFAVAHATTCPRLRTPAWREQHDLPGYFVTNDLYPGCTLARAMRAFRRRWTVEVAIRLCECTNQLVNEPVAGALVDYHGSLEHRHGRYLLQGQCDCEHCWDAVDTYGRYAAVRWSLAAYNQQGRFVRLEHVRSESFAVMALPLPEAENPAIPQQ